MSDPNQPQYGQPQYDPPQYGQPYGTPAPAGGRRPGTVTAAAVLTWVFSGVALLAGVLFSIGAAVARDDVVKELEKDADFRELDIDAGAFTDALVAIGIIMAVLGALAIVVAVLAFRGSQAGRVTLVVLSAIGAVIALVASLAIIPFLWVIACVATIVLLFTGGASQWYANR